MADVPLVPETPAPLIKVKCFDTEQTFAFHANAALSCFDETLQPRLGDPISETTMHGPQGDVKLPLYRTPEISLGRTRLPGHRAACRELNTLSEVLGQPVTGVLGIEAMEPFVVELDLVGKRLRLRAHVPARIVEQSECFELRRTNRGWVVMGEVADGEPVEFSFNTGTSGGITLSPPIFDRLRTSGAVTDCVGLLYQSTGGRIVSQEGLLRRIALGRFKHVDLSVARSDTCGLGCQYLRRYILVFDFPRKRLYLRPSSDFDLPQPKGDRSGLWILRRGEATVVCDCMPDSPASEAGFAKDDHVLQINGEPVARLSLQTIRNRLRNEGETVEVTAARGDETFTRKLTLRNYWKMIALPSAEAE